MTSGAEVIDISTRVEEKRSEHDLVAFGGLVIVGRKIAAIGVAGERKRKSGVPVTTDDRWHLGSCGKAMTATVIARLIEQGKLSWSATLGELLGGTMPIRPEYREVTVAELLQHRGGMVATTDTGPVTERIWEAAEAAGADLRVQRAAAAHAILGEEPEAPRGSFLYSNSGYILVGAVAEHVTGRLWEDVMATELFGPVKMKSAGFGAPGTPGLIDQPCPHRSEGDELVPVDVGREHSDNVPFTSPVGRVHCSMEDWARFVLTHLEGEAGSTGYLSSESWRRLHAPPPGHAYAMGWRMVPDEWAGYWWRHTGTNGYNYAEINVSSSRGFAMLQVRNECRPRGSDALLDIGIEIATCMA